MSVPTTTEQKCTIEQKLLNSQNKIMKELLQSDLSFDKSENVNVDRAEFVDPMIKDSMKKKIQGSAGT